MQQKSGSCSSNSSSSSNNDDDLPSVDICPQLLVDRAVLNRAVLNPDFRILIKYYWIFL